MRNRQGLVMNSGFIYIFPENKKNKRNVPHLIMWQPKKALYGIHPLDHISWNNETGVFKAYRYRQHHKLFKSNR